jgi:thiol-disulfide isomerase/thioredoxin
MKRIFMLGLFVPFMAVAQQNGIRFLTGLSWRQVLAKARTENKYIFVDCYATWCGPCKYMTDSVFTQSEVGSFFNSQFLNISVQFDKTDHDAQVIKDWYADADSLIRRYTIATLPTYLFFSPDGILVHRIVGVPGNRGSELISQAKEALVPATQNQAYTTGYRQHLHDSAYLREALTTAIRQNDQNSAEQIGNVYFGLLSEPLQKEAIGLMIPSIQSTRDVAFGILLDHLAETDRIMGRKHYANYVLDMTITMEALDSLFQDPNVPISYGKYLSRIQTRYPMLDTGGQPTLTYIASENFKAAIVRQIREQIYRQGAPPADWREISKAAKRRYPNYDAGQLILDQEWNYYRIKKDTVNFEKAVLSFMEKYRHTLSARMINNCCYYIYLYSSDASLLQKAARWSKAVVDDPKSVLPTYIDTYASLLFKTGRRDDAVRWEEQAIKTAMTATEKKEFEKTLKEMAGGSNSN